MFHPENKRMYAQACIEIAEWWSTTSVGLCLFSWRYTATSLQEKSSAIEYFWVQPEFYFRSPFLEKSTGWLLKQENITPFTDLFFHPCCVSVGLLAEGCNSEDKEKTHRLHKNPQCNDSAWPVPGRDTTTRMLKQQSPAQLDIFYQLHPALHHLQFLCFLPDTQAHTPHSSCSWFWSHSCRSTGFQEVVHLSSFISALMNSFILE